MIWERCRADLEAAQAPRTTSEARRAGRTLRARHVRLHRAVLVRDRATTGCSARPRSAARRRGSACARRSSRARTSSSTATPCGASCVRRSSAPTTSSSRWARGSARSPSRCCRDVARVVAVEIDDVLAPALPATVEARRPDLADRLEVVHADALRGARRCPARRRPRSSRTCPTTSRCPVVLHLLEPFPSIRRVLVMVQLEVADRLAAGPGSKVYGVPSVKARWYGDVARVGKVGRTVFWPAPNVDCGLVALTRTAPPETTATRERGLRRGRRRVRPAPQDAAGRARRAGPARPPPPRRPCAPPASTPARAASSSTSPRSRARRRPAARLASSPEPTAPARSR